MNGVCLITGASRGIGESLARRLAKQGCSLALVARPSQKLNQLALELSQITKCRAYEVDLASEVSADDLLYRIENEVGPLNFLVNNAADLVVKPLTQTTEDEFDRLIQINVTWPYFLMQAFFASIERARTSPASIVNIASVAGLQEFEKFPGLSAYSASKAAVIAMSQAAAAEGKALGIRVNCVAPGAVDTEMLDKAAPHITERLSPDHVAKVIEELLVSDRSGDIKVILP